MKDGVGSLMALRALQLPIGCDETGKEITYECPGCGDGIWGIVIPATRPGYLPNCDDALFVCDACLWVGGPFDLGMPPIPDKLTEPDKVSDT